MSIGFTFAKPDATPEVAAGTKHVFLRRRRPGWLANATSREQRDLILTRHAPVWETLITRAP
jgi:hypothetical protein